MLYWKCEIPTVQMHTYAHTYILRCKGDQGNQTAFIQNELIVHLRHGKTTSNLECTVIAQSITVAVHKESEAKPQGERYSAIRHMRC